MSPATTAPPLVLSAADSDASDCHTRPARGVLFGIVLGVAMWAVILALVLPILIN